jgi:hypothetical protein
MDDLVAAARPATGHRRWAAYSRTAGRSLRVDADEQHVGLVVGLLAFVEAALAHAVVIDDCVDIGGLDGVGDVEADLLGGAGDQRALGLDGAEGAQVK